MKRQVLVQLLLVISVCNVSACSGTSDGIEENRDIEAPISYSVPVPVNYFQPALQQGTIEVLEYESKDYTRNGTETISKPAYIYLPYGYDESKKYDIIYLMHGWTGVAEEYFMGRSGNNKTPMVHLFDNMIQNGDCAPFIAVSPTWDKDNASKDWGESTDEVAVFHNEYINDLMPAVESKYSTYAESYDIEGLLASREHRAFGGFSLGAITTWYIFENAFDYQKFFLPMSGDNWHIRMFGGQSAPVETAEFLASVVNASPYKENFHVWYAVGTADSRFAQTHNQAMAMMAIPETFNSSNFSYHQREGGRHDFNSVWEFCYNAIPFMFPTDNHSGITTIKTDDYTISSDIPDTIYTMDGRRVTKADKGFYIINGMKVIK